MILKGIQAIVIGVHGDINLLKSAWVSLVNIGHLTNKVLAYVRRQTSGGEGDLFRQGQDCKVVLEWIQQGIKVKPGIIDNIADIGSCHTVFIIPLPAKDNLDGVSRLVHDAQCCC